MTPATLTISSDPGSATARCVWAIAGDEGGLESMGGDAPVAASATLDPPAEDRATLSAGKLTAAVSGSVPLTAELVASDPAPPLIRVLLVGSATGRGLLIASEGATPDGPHGEESAHAWTLGEGQWTEFGEALLSTEYDGDGLPTRAGWELWPTDDDALAVRGAVTVVGTARVPEPGQTGVTAAIISGASEGDPVLGAYLIARVA